MPNISGSYKRDAREERRRRSTQEAGIRERIVHSIASRDRRDGVPCSRSVDIHLEE
jgi:hypothetical protein